MTDQKPAATEDQEKPAVKPQTTFPGKKPGAIIEPGKPSLRDPRSPRAGTGRIMAMARPAALPVPVRRDISALSRPEILSRWEADAAGVRAVEVGDNVITMFDMIGEDYWSGGGVTAKKVTSQLRAIGARPVEVQINSPGGDMFEGIAIYNVLREHPQPVTIKVMGMAASAASIIAMAADTLEIGAASFLMIHNCWVLAAGNRHDMQETAEFLAPFDAAMAEVYAQRSGQKVEDIAKWMDAETFISGSRAIELGLADALLPADKVKTDPEAQASAKELNRLRAMETSLMQARGLSRTEARAEIEEIRGTTDSAPADKEGTTDSADHVETQAPPDWLGDAQALLASLQNRKTPS